MPGFRQLPTSFPLLVIDAASALVQVGYLNSDGTGTWATDTAESGVAIFRGLERLGVDPLAVSAFAFCDGPGSVLGIRTAAMALRTWQVLRPRPVYAYSSLAVVAHALGRPEVGVIADARRDTWHHYQIGRGLRRIPTGELAGELVQPEHFRHWSALPAGLPVPAVSYDLATLLPKVWDADLLRPSPAPDAFLHEEPQYVKWSPQVHQSPAAGATGG